MEYYTATVCTDVLDPIKVNGCEKFATGVAAHMAANRWMQKAVGARLEDLGKMDFVHAPEGATRYRTFLTGIVSGRQDGEYLIYTCKFDGQWRGAPKAGLQANILWQGTFAQDIRIRIQMHEIEVIREFTDEMDPTSRRV